MRRGKIRKKRTLILLFPFFFFFFFLKLKTNKKKKIIKGENTTWDEFTNIEPRSFYLILFKRNSNFKREGGKKKVEKK